MLLLLYRYYLVTLSHGSCLFVYLGQCIILGVNKSTLMLCNSYIRSNTFVCIDWYSSYDWLGIYHSRCIAFDFRNFIVRGLQSDC